MGEGRGGPDRCSGYLQSGKEGIGGRRGVDAIGVALMDRGMWVWHVGVVIGELECAMFPENRAKSRTIQCARFPTKVVTRGCCEIQTYKLLRKYSFTRTYYAEEALP